MSDSMRIWFTKAGNKALSDVELPAEWLDDLVRYGFARLGNLEDAEDAAMEVWHEANRRPSRVLNAANPRAFLIGMARRRVVDRFRSRTRDRSREGAPGASSEVDPQILAVDEVLGLLSADYREALVLKYVHEFTQDEIAEILGITPAASNSLLQRARAAFRQHGAHLADGEEKSQ